MLTWQAAKKLALALPETDEHDHVGRPAFRVHNKILAALWPKERRAVLKFSPADEMALIALDPATFESLPHRGRHGWTFVQLAKTSPGEFRGLLLQAWRQVAPRRLVAAASRATSARR